LVYHWFFHEFAPFGNPKGANIVPTKAKKETKIKNSKLPRCLKMPRCPGQASEAAGRPDKTCEEHRERETEAHGRNETGRE